MPNRQNSWPTQVFTVRKRLAVRVARRHVQIGPDLRQVLLLDAEQVDPLAAGQLDHRHVVLLGHVGDPAQLLGGGDPAAHLRDDGEGAVLLDVGVHPVVDEPALAVVGCLAPPHHLQQRRQPHLGLRVLGAVGSQRGEHLGHRPQTAVADLGHQRRLVHAGCPARSSGPSGSSSTAPPAANSTSWATRPLQEPQPLPARVASITPVTVLQPALTVSTIVLLADTVAVADLGVVGHLGDADLLRGTAQVEQQLDPCLRQRQSAIEGLLQEGDLLAVAEQGRADHLAVPDHHRLVDPAAGLGEDDVLVGLPLGLGDAHRGDLDAGHLQLGGRPGAEVEGVRVGPGDQVGQHHGLLPQRRHQAVDLAAVLHALPHRVHLGSSTVRIWSSTTIARSTVKPEVVATSVFGRMPAA